MDIRASLRLNIALKNKEYNAKKLLPFLNAATHTIAPHRRHEVTARCSSTTQSSRGGAVGHVNYSQEAPPSPQV